MTSLENKKQWGGALLEGRAGMRIYKLILCGLRMVKILSQLSPYNTICMTWHNEEKI
jgi:hypothetical protein